MSNYKVFSQVPELLDVSLTGWCSVKMIHLRSVLLKYYITQDRQCSYNITMRCVRVIIVAVEMQYVLHIVGVCL
jgi:hypothetical protein